MPIGTRSTSAAIPAPCTGVGTASPAGRSADRCSGRRMRRFGRRRRRGAIGVRVIARLQGVERLYGPPDPSRPAWPTRAHARSRRTRSSRPVTGTLRDDRQWRRPWPRPDHSPPRSISGASSAGAWRAVACGSAADTSGGDPMMIVADDAAGSADAGAAVVSSGTCFAEPCESGDAAGKSAMAKPRNPAKPRSASRCALPPNSIVTRPSPDPSGH